MVIEGLRERILSLVEGRWGLLFILLALLTSIILLFPVQLRYEYHPIQSVHIFENLSLFSALYSIWLVFLCLLLLAAERKSEWRMPALMATFALLFLGFWPFIAPNRAQDGLINLIAVKHIYNEGILSPRPYIPYSDFPASHILCAALCHITGLGVFDGARLLLVFNGILISLLLYLLFRNCLNNVLIAALGTFIAIQGNWQLDRMTFFYPGYFALPLLLAFLMLLHEKERELLEKWQSKIVVIILLIAVTSTHFVTSTTFFFILSGIYLVQVIRKKKIGYVPMISLSLIIPLAWGIYNAFATFGSIVGFLPLLQKHLLELEFLTSFWGVRKANISEAVPLWANITRLFWLVLIYGVGLLFWLRNMVRIRKLSWVEGKEVGGLLGIIALTIVATIASEQGSQFHRILMYGPFFTIPIILRPLLRMLKPEKFLIILISLFLILSLPSFFAHNDRISIDAWYPQDFTPAQFLESSYGKGESLHVFSFGNTIVPFQYEMLYIKHKEEGWVLGEEEAWRRMGEVITAFENFKAEGALFAFSRRPMGFYERDFGMSSVDPRWEAFELSLQSKNKIYDNSWVQLYKQKI